MARRLLSAAEDLARDRGKEAIALHVTADNLPALRLYESEGYKEISRQRSLITAYLLNIREWLYLKKEL
jgi:ribosomal protein S18 acetylase RimI-like enzyme